MLTKLHLCIIRIHVISKVDLHVHMAMSSLGIPKKVPFLCRTFEENSWEMCVCGGEGGGGGGREEIGKLGVCMCACMRVLLREYEKGIPLHPNRCVYC